MPNERWPNRSFDQAPPPSSWDRRPRTEDPPPLGLEAPVRPNLTTIAVRSPGFHPFLFRKMIIGPRLGPRPRDGDLVRVVDRDSVPLGYGLWNVESEITLRLIAPVGDAPGPEWWAERLGRAVDLRRVTLGLDEATDAYRLVHAEADGLSGLIVDRYGPILSAEIFSLGMYRRAACLMPMLAERSGATHWRVRVDERIAEAENFPGRPLASEGCPDRVAIREHGIRYRVRFEGGHKTGFFCDQRDNRRELAAFCRDRSVLDVCSYSGGFALNALIRGGAREVTAVDLDEKAVAMARENANLNQVRMSLTQSDAFGYLRQMGVNRREFGVVVLDPPKLIATRDDFEVGLRKYNDLNTLAMSVVETGGLLLTCSCSGLLSQDEFLATLRSAARRAGRFVQILRVTGPAADHPVALEVPEGSYLKAAWLLVGERRAERAAGVPASEAEPSGLEPGVELG